MAEGEVPPVLGVLTRTLVKSPVIKLIIPAQILDFPARNLDSSHHQNVRILDSSLDSSHHRNVIIVRIDSIEISTVLGDSKKSLYLQHVISKTDFDSSIRAARILGKSRTYEKIEKAEENKPHEEGEKAPRSLHKQHSFVKLEIPSHILALTLESSKLVFLCAFYDLRGHPQWLSSYRVLWDEGRPYSKRLGEHLAVDSKSRAMAVAAYEDSFALFGLKTMDELKEDVESPIGLQSSKFDPIIDERIFPVDGVILKMEFLHPSKGDTDEVILLVITAKEQKTRLRIYVWDCSYDLRQARELGSGQRVTDDDQLPLLLIPLRMSSAFMLVFQEHITVYKDILTGPATPHKHILRHWEPPEQPGNSRDLPIFTQWARVLRHDDHAAIQDNIFLCREDGVVRFLEISNNMEKMIDSGHDAGRLKVNINTAFASIDLGGRSADLLVAGGDLSNGGLWVFGPRKRDAELNSTIPNWTPLINMIAVKVQGEQSSGALSISGTVQKQTRVFASTGRGTTHGEVIEVRYGIEGAIVAEGEPIESVVTDMWALHDSSGKNIHVLISSPTDTTPLLIRSDITELPDAEPPLEITSSALEITTSGQTIAAGLTTDGCIVQVTPTTIVVVSPLDRTRRLFVDFKVEFVTSASILTSDISGCVLLTTTKKDSANHLQCHQVRTDSDVMYLKQLGDPVEMSAEVSCSSLLEIQGKICAFVGTSTGLLLVFGRNHSIGPSLQMTSKHEFEGDFAICDTIATIIDEDQGWLVCGLRNGVCQTFSLALEGRILLTPLESLNFGSTSVKAKMDEKQQGRAIIACEDIFCSLEYSHEQPQNATIRNILLTNEDKPAYSQSSIITFTQVLYQPTGNNQGFAAGQWFCIEGENFHLVDIRSGSHSRMIPRRMYLDGTPSRITYSDKLNKMIVLYTRTVIKRERQRGRPGLRADEPTFAFLDMDKGSLRPDPQNNKLRVILPNDESQEENVLSVKERKPGEKFLGMTEWLPTDGERVYHMLIVFTMIEYQDERDRTGRLLFFTLSKDVNGQVSMKNKRIAELKAPIYAVVPYGQSSLIYSCGNDIYLHTLKAPFTPPEWLPPIIVPLQSRGVHLSVSGNYVHVTTAADSLSVLKVSDSHQALTLQCSDEIARDGIFHLDLPAHGLVILSSKAGTITGLQGPARRRISNSMHTAFVAEFPGSITRLQRMTRPPWQLNESSPALGMSNESVIACTTDGSLYQMDILEESSWRLLRFIVNMAQRHPLVCPYREKFKPMSNERHARHIEPLTSNKRFMQVKGDILIRLLERGGEKLLNDIVYREPYYGDDEMVDFDTVAARARRFWELAETAGFKAGDFQAIARWIQGMLARVL